MSHRYARSEALLARAEALIPLGTQTFSKSRTQYPHGVSPYYLTHGRGARVWDVDGNEYVDFVNALAAVTLGYDDPDVTAAVQRQLGAGVSFTLAHPVEIQVAEKLVEMVPCAQRVRFGKNGSDVTAAAVRLARAYTGRDHVAVCGYHGWQDWYIGATARHRGVPGAVRELTHPFVYNDLDSLERLFREHPGGIAAVILEPMNVTPPVPGFLGGVKAMAADHGAVLVFDEMVTGFRFARGGAQEHFGVVPDLATFGKGLANGFPLSAIAGRAEIMDLMEEIFFSFTFGGEALSLAAALATLEKLQRQPVLERLAARGREVMDGVRNLIRHHGLEEVLSVSGHPAWSFLTVRDAGGCPALALKTLLMQETLARGVLSLGSHNMSYAHGEAEVQRLLEAYDQVFPLLGEAVEKGTVEGHLRCAPLQPLFRVR